MPYILSPKIKLSSSGMWSEGAAYEKKSIYSISSGKLPPVNYDEHIIRPHSLTHIETPAHTSDKGKRMDFYYQNPSNFFGRTLVIKLSGNRFGSLGNGVHWEITKEEISEKLNSVATDKIPEKILITTENYPENFDGYHDPSFVLTLSQAAADYLINLQDFHLYGTSWKSSDYNPGKAGRPIHNTLFKKAIILENLILNHVPEGIYFMNAFPLPLENASESPVVPVLFTREELKFFIDTNS